MTEIEFYALQAVQPLLDKITDRIAVLEEAIEKCQNKTDIANTVINLDNPNTYNNITILENK